MNNPPDDQGHREVEHILDSLDGPIPREDLVDCLEDDACSRRLDWYLWALSLPVDRLAQELASMLEPGITPLPEPTDLSGYEGLSQAAKREAWMAWYMVSLMDPHRSPVAHPGSGLSVSAQDPAGTEGGGPGAPRDLDSPWRFDAHGTPKKWIPGAGEDDGYLVTDLGLLYFPEAGGSPDWMVRPSSPVREARAVPDASGDTARVVLRTMPGWDSTEASIIVVDRDGEVGFAGFASSQRLLYWDLTDVDSDGELDLIGLDQEGFAVAAKLDGTMIYRERIVEVPDVPSASPPVVPVYLAMGHARGGGRVMGDVDGDGTLDFILPGYVSAVSILVLFVLYQITSTLEAYSGTDLELIWARAEPPSRASVMAPVDTGDLTGDGRDDVLVSYIRYDSLPGVPVPVIAWTMGVHVFSGLDGTTVVRDDYAMACLAVACEGAGLLSHSPLALIDLEGDGQARLLTVETRSGVDSYEIDLVLREPTVPGGPSVETDRHTVPLGSGSLLDYHRSNDGAESLWVHTLFFEGATSDRTVTSKHVLLGSNGLTRTTTDQALGILEKDPRTGDRLGWLLRQDRWVLLDDDLAARGDGVELVVEAEPVLFHDETGDGVQDVLLETTFGYRWVSGADGSRGDRVDGVPGAYWRETGVHEGEPVILEYDTVDRQYGLYGTDRALHGTIDRDDGFFQDMGDVTGDGALEILLRSDEVLLARLDDGESLWSAERAFGDSVELLELDGDREGLEVLHASRGESEPSHEPEPGLQSGVGRTSSSSTSPDHWSLDLKVYGPDDDEALWGLEREDDRFVDAGGGVVVLRGWPGDHEDADHLEFLDGASGESLGALVVEQLESDWYRRADSLHLVDVTGDGRAELLYLYEDVDQAERPPGLRQGVLVVQAEDAEVLAEFSLSPPEYRERASGWWSVTESSFESPVGDWDGDGWTDLLFKEHESPVVRSSQDGRILAVAPEGDVAAVSDLAGDGPKDILLQQPGRLSLFGYAEGRGAFEDPELQADVDRWDDPANVEGEPEETEDKGLPGPGFGLLVLVVGILAFRRYRPRRDRTDSS